MTTKYKHTKYKHLYVNDVFINPETGLEFKKGDQYLDKHFRGFYLNRPVFCNKEKDKKNRNLYKKRYRFRNSLNPNLLNSIACKLIYDSKRRAKKFCGKHTLTKKWVLDALKIGVCQGSSPPLRFVFDKPRSPFSPSLDRIDSRNRDYTKENTRVVCNGINTARSNFSNQETLQICERLGGFIKKRRNSI